MRSVGDEDMQVLTLEGGIKGWVKGGPQYIQLMDGYEEEHWRELFALEEAVKEGEGKGADASASPEKKRKIEGDVVQ